MIHVSPDFDAFRLPLTITSLAISLWGVLPASAQITGDRTLPTPSTTLLTPDGSQALIEGGTIRGNNLFHSFTDFNVGAGQQVYFANPDGIETIFSRVTGGDRSNILGTLGIDGVADLFLLNPNGILFGPDSILDIAGSIVMTTGESLTFTNGDRFSAVVPDSLPLLTVNTPVGIQYSHNPQPIDLMGSALALFSQQPLALLGGNINLNGATITNLGGSIILGGLAKVGLLSLDLNSPAPEQILTMTAEMQPADLVLKDSILDTAASGGGDIVLSGRTIVLTRSGLVTGIQQDLGTAESHGGNILINASADVTLAEESQIASFVDAKALGQSGDIVIRAENLDLLDSYIWTEAVPVASQAGDIEIEVDNRLLASAAQSGVFYGSSVTSSGSGITGMLRLQAQDIRIEDGALIATYNEGASQGQALAGDIQIQTNRLTITAGEIYTAIDGPGQGGDIQIQATNILIDDRGDAFRDFPAAINTAEGVDGFSAGGISGDITLDTQNLTMIGGYVGTAIAGNNAGAAGNIIIRAEDTVQLTGDAAARFNSLGGGNLDFAGTSRIAVALRTDTSLDIRGRAMETGEITIQARHLILENGAIITAAADGDGSSGNIAIQAEESITLQGQLAGQPSRIVSQLQNAAAGNRGGNIDIQTKRLDVRDAGQISAGTLGAGPGGDIRIDAGESIRLAGSTPVVSLLSGDAETSFILDETGSRFPGGIFADSTANIPQAVDQETLISTGDAGDIRITTPRLEVSDRAQISVRSTNAGAAGEISIDADTIRLDQMALMSAATVEGSGANIDISAQDSVFLLNGSRITTNASGSASGGNLTISNPQIFLMGNQSSLITENSGGSGNGGNIDLNSRFLIATPEEPNLIIANAFLGNGGNIRINTDTLLGPSLLEIDASSTGGGIDGEISLDILDADPANGLQALPSVLLADSDRIITGCSAHKGSRFSIVNQGGLPADPRRGLRGMAIARDLRLSPTQEQPKQHQPNQFRRYPAQPQASVGSQLPRRTMIEAQGWSQDAVGKVTLVAASTFASYDASPSSGCQESPPIK